MAALCNGLYSITQLFSDRCFVIPDFQRGYAWGLKQIGEFWKDLELLHAGARHYAGQVILEAMPELDDHHYRLIDGQQRLTTCFLALKAAADALNAIGTPPAKERAAALTRQFLIEKSGGLREYKLSYTNGNPGNLYLAGVIFDDPRHRAHAGDLRTLYTENIRRAYAYFHDAFTAQPVDQVLIMVGRITEALLCNVFCVTDDFNVHVAFETINNRGKDLSKLELLKNRLIYLTTVFEGIPTMTDLQAEDLRSEINDSWSTIYKWLGNESGRQLDDDDFLATHWIAFFGYDKSEADALKGFLFDEYFTSRGVREGSLAVDNVQRYIRSLAQAAALWHYLHVPVRYLPNACAAWLERIERLRWSSFKPLLLAAFLRLAADDPRVISTPSTAGFDAINALLQQVERYIFMVYYMTERRGHTGRTEIYKTAAILCPDGLRADLGASAAADLDWAARKIAAMNDECAADQDDDGNGGEFASLPSYFDLHLFRDGVRQRLSQADGFYNWDFTKVVLFEYEQMLQGHHNAPKVTWKHVSNETIEHIYPCTPTHSYWQQRFPYDKRQARKQRMWRNSLGNLLLLSTSINASLGNSTFPDKAIKYKQGSFSATALASSHRHWTRKSIVERGEVILKFLEQRWRIDFKHYGVKYKDCLVVPELE